MTLGQSRVAVFAKVPRLGHVKTRLGESIGTEAALECYTEMLESAIRATSGYPMELWFDEEPNADWASRGIALRRQSGNDLGERMLNALSDGVELIVGSDIPELNAEYVNRACGLLLESDVVIGPTEDGGYCLIGMRQPHPWLFQDIEWSTPRVFERTLSIAGQLRLSVSLLDTLWDVDDLDDYRRWMSMKSIRR